MEKNFVIAGIMLGLTSIIGFGLIAYGDKASKRQLENMKDELKIKEKINDLKVSAIQLEKEVKEEYEKRRKAHQEYVKNKFDDVGGFEKYSPYNAYSVKHKNVSSEDKALLFDELSSIENLINDSGYNNKETDKNIEKYLKIQELIKKEDECVAFIEHLKMQKKQEEIEAAHAFELKKRQQEIDAEKEILRMKQEHEQKTLETQNQQQLNQYNSIRKIVEAATRE